MADYHSPTVVEPFIPQDEMTPLERLLLGLAFDTETEPDGRVYFHSWCGPSDLVTLLVDDLRAACEASREPGDSSIARHVSAQLARIDAEQEEDPPDDVDVDLTEADSGWDRMFQDIVRRSATIEEIVVTTAWTCSKMRPDGFGGSVMLITAEAVLYRSTADMLEEMREQPQPPGQEDASGHETRGRLEEVAAVAGWDSSTLLLLIARWLNWNRHAGTLIDHLDRLVDADGG
ncbi:MAG: hypothetical protein EKK31_05420 [Hyphomicrobiales bacterium]|nr:MAG: hypothetical protein EKK31_05420 [Hyphomicrobiales bacterium]